MNNGKLKNFLKKIKLNESLISIILGTVVVIVVGVLIFNYFKGVGKEEGVITLPPEEVQLVEEEGKIVPLGLPTTYTVQEDDNLWKIAEKFYSSGYNWVDIANENNLANANILLVGQELNIPKAEVIMPTVEVSQPTINGDSYTVEKGDNLWEIAVRAYGDGYQWVEIASENGLGNPDLIHPGNILTIPR
jgi:nucleoid-associated protein YgaU